MANGNALPFRRDGDNAAAAIRSARKLPSNEDSSGKSGDFWKTSARGNTAPTCIHALTVRRRAGGISAKASASGWIVVNIATHNVIKIDITARFSSGLLPNVIRLALGALISASALRISSELDNARSRNSVQLQFSPLRARRTIARSARIARAACAH